MRSAAVFLIASAIGMSSAWTFQQMGHVRNEEEPSISDMLAHLKARDQLTWEDLGK